MKRSLLIGLAIMLLVSVGGVVSCGPKVAPDRNLDAAVREATDKPEVEEEAAPTPEVTPTPTQYPWKSIFILEAMAPMIEGNVLEVHIDFGRELSSNEFDGLSEEVKLIDENGRGYHPVGYSSSTGATIIITQPEFVRWEADFAYGFVFEVESKSSSYTLSWPDHLPLEIGNPFESPFCLGCE